MNYRNNISLNTFQKNYKAVTILITRFKDKYLNKCFFFKRCIFFCSIDKMFTRYLTFYGWCFFLCSDKKTENTIPLFFLINVLSFGGFYLTYISPRRLPSPFPLSRPLTICIDLVLHHVPYLYMMMYTPIHHWCILDIFKFRTIAIPCFYLLIVDPCKSYDIRPYDVIRIGLGSCFMFTGSVLLMKCFTNTSPYW